MHFPISSNRIVLNTNTNANDGDGQNNRDRKFMGIQRQQYSVSSKPMEKHCEQCDEIVTTSIRYVETPIHWILIQFLKLFVRLSILGFVCSFAALFLFSTLLWLDRNFLNWLPFHIYEMIYFRLIPYSLWAFILFSILRIITWVLFPNGTKSLQSAGQILKNVEHHCPQCGKFLAVYKFSWDPFVGNFHFQLAPILGWLGFGPIRTEHNLRTEHHFHMDELMANIKIAIPVEFHAKLEKIITEHVVKIDANHNFQHDVHMERPVEVNHGLNCNIM